MQLFRSQGEKDKQLGPVMLTDSGGELYVYDILVSKSECLCAQDKINGNPLPYMRN